MKIKVIQRSEPEYESLCQLRDEVLRKPIGLRLSEEDRKKDVGDTLVACLENSEVVACCILTKLDDQTVKFRQMAVRQDLQGKQIGAEVLRFAEQTAREIGYTYVTLNARKTALGFYEKFGYQISGNEFTEVGIPHFVMNKSI